MAKALEAEAKGQTKELPPPAGINTGQISNLAARFKDSFGPYNEALKDCRPEDRQLIKDMVADKLAGKFDQPKQQEAGMMTIGGNIEQQKPEEARITIGRTSYAPDQLIAWGGAPDMVTDATNASSDDSKYVIVGGKKYPAEDVISRDWGASLKKGWDRTVQSVQHPDLIGWENPPAGGVWRQAFLPLATV